MTRNEAVALLDQYAAARAARDQSAPAWAWFIEAQEKLLEAAPTISKLLSTAHASGREEGERARNELREVLARCRDQFQHYADLHREKGTEEGELKAVTNASFATLCAIAISRSALPIPSPSQDGASDNIGGR